MNIIIKTPLNRTDFHIIGWTKTFVLVLSAVFLIGFTWNTEIRPVDGNNFSSFARVGLKSPEEKAVGFYHNPVIPGDFPDPTVLRVGNMYYAAGTSNDFGPCYPLYESTDLVNWKAIGTVFNDCPKWACNNFWAP